MIEWKYGLQAVWTIPHFIIFNFFSLHIHTIGMVMVVTISTLCTDAKWLQSLFASLTLFIHVLCSRRHHYILWSGHLDTRCRKNKGGLDKLQNNQITLYAYLMEKNNLLDTATIFNSLASVICGSWFENIIFNINLPINIMRIFWRNAPIFPHNLNNSQTGRNKDYILVNFLCLLSYYWYLLVPSMWFNSSINHL